MDLRPYIDNLRNEFAVAAEAGAPEARSVAEQLFTQLEAATRLTLLDALSAAADEITRDLAPGSVHVRLRGREPVFVVTPVRSALEDAAEGARSTLPSAPVPTAGSAPESDDGGTSRINLRLPDHLKASVEEAAGQTGVSVNTWLVRAAAATLESAHRDRDQRSARRADSGSGQHLTGWVR